MPEIDPPCPETEGAVAGTLARVGCGLLGLVALAAMVRAVWMGVTQSHDLEIVLTSARAWRLGLDPYDPQVFREVWQQTPGHHDRAWLGDETHALYPPSTYVLLAPLTLVPLGAAKLVWALVNVAAWVLMMVGLKALGGASAGGARGVQKAMPFWLVPAAVLLLYPVQTHFRFGQTALVAVALVLWALGAWERATPCPVRSGLRRAAPALAAGVALALKPQLALPLLGFAVLRRRGVGVLMSGAVAAGFLAVGAAWTAGHGHRVWAGLTHNVSRLAASGFLRADGAGELRHQLINLHVALHAFTDNPAWVRGGVLITVAALSYAVAWRVGWRRQRVDVLAAVAAIGVLSLMVTYHRGYDAVVLAPAVAWVIRQVWAAPGPAGVPRWSVVGVGLGLLAFLSPGGSWMVTLANRGWVPGPVEAWAGWHYVIVPHQAWALWWMAVVLTWVVVRGAGDVESENLDAGG